MVGARLLLLLLLRHFFTCWLIGGNIESWNSFVRFQTHQQQQQIPLAAHLNWIEDFYNLAAFSQIDDKLKCRKAD